jgi:hypothetical protein
MDYTPSEIEIHEPDFEMLGLKYELIGWLAENDLHQYSDYQDVEADCGNAELLIREVQDHEKFNKALRHFAMTNNMTHRWVSERGYFKLWRSR